MLLLLSDEFLMFHRCSSVPRLANLLLSNPAILPFIHRSSFFMPNYGPLWFRARDAFVYSTKEVLLRSVVLSAIGIASNAEAYYDAMCRKSGVREDGAATSYRFSFAYSFAPDNDTVNYYTCSNLIQRVKTLYTSLPVDN